ncbi:hypothetical protein ACI2K4_02330 [Micromonospora sp. NPDC050397]|uniref:hypothetical protein n=1 Tax=Micromonospora sp. NPDC050397 TaxID=3364279 RepID=UPI0038515013
MYLKVPVTDDEGGDPASTMPRRPGGHVTYTRRFARGGGERLPVYVAPDYDGPPRA